MNSLSAGVDNVCANLSCVVLTDEAAFAQIERDWNALYGAMDAPYLSDSYDWASLSWRLASKPRRRRLFCLVVRHSGRTVAIFPLVAAQRGVWRVASPLCSEASEYSPFLIHPRANPAQVMAAIACALKDAPGLDGLYLPNVREDEPVGLWLAGHAGAVRTFTRPTARIRFEGFSDWESYFATRSSHMRAELRRKVRGLERLGDVQWCEITDPQERQAVWRWLVERKRATLARRGMNAWLLSHRHVDFTAATLEAFGDKRPILAIKLDGAVIAAGLCSVGPTRVEGFVMAFDEGHGKLSPGALLQMHCTRWAFERSLDFDMRTGQEAFKTQWANHHSQVSSYAVPLGPLGGLYVASERVRRWGGMRAPQSARAVAQRWISAARRRAGRPRAAAGAE